MSCPGRDFEPGAAPDVMTAERSKLAKCRGLLYALLFEKEGGDAVTAEEIQSVLDATGDGV